MISIASYSRPSIVSVLREKITGGKSEGEEGGVTVKVVKSVACTDTSSYTP